MACPVPTCDPCKDSCPIPFPCCPSYISRKDYNATVIGISVSLGIVCGVLLPLLAALIFNYRRKWKKILAQQNITKAANAGAEFTETITENNKKPFLNFFARKNTTGTANAGEKAFETANVGAELTETVAENNTEPTSKNEAEAQEVVDENEKVLEELQKEIIILEKQKRVAELKREIKDLE